MAVQQILGKSRIETIPDAQIVASQLARLKSVPDKNLPRDLRSLKRLEKTYTRKCNLLFAKLSEDFDYFADDVYPYFIEQNSDYIALTAVRSAIADIKHQDRARRSRERWIKMQDQADEARYEANPYARFI